MKCRHSIAFLIATALALTAWQKRQPSQTLNNDDADIESGSVEFILAEYQALQADFTRLRQEGTKRLQALIVLSTSAAAAAVGIGGLESLSTSRKNQALIGALAFIILFSFETHRYIVVREIVSDFDLRALGRIRRYFVDKEPGLTKYLTWQYIDVPSAKLVQNQSNMLRTAHLFVGASVATLAFFLAWERLSELTSIAIASGAGLIVWSYLRWATRRSFKRAAAKASEQSRFPS